MGALITTPLGVALLAFSAAAVTATLGIRGRAPFIASALVVSAAEVVAVSIVLSPLGWVTRLGVLAGTAVVTAASAGLWHARGRPRPPTLGRPGWRDLRGAARAMVLIASAALLIQLYVGARVAPSNWDSMTYHLSRAAYWLQEGSVFHYAGATTRQAGSAPNGEILQMWTMLMTGSDTWVEIVQWVALVGVSVLVLSGARLMRFSLTAAAFAAALFVVLPQPVMQSVSTQNDLIVAFFITATAFFSTRGLRDRNLGDLAVAGAAAGLAVGTKGTAFVVAPALAVIAVAAVVAFRPGGRTVLIGAAFTAAGLLGLGAYNYVLNEVHRGDLLGGLSAQVQVPPGTDRAKNAVQDLWTLADAPGMNVSWLQPLADGPPRALLSGVAGDDFPFAVDAGVQEDTTAFGLVGFLLLMPLLLVALLGRSSPRDRRVLAGAVLLFLCVFGWQLGVNPWLGRLMVPGVALAAPLFAMFARREWLAGAVGALACLSLVPSLLQNSQKPLLVPRGENNVFAWSRIEQMTVARPDLGPALTKLASIVHPGARVGFVGGEDSWDYPVFGPHREIQVVRMASIEEATYSRMRREGLQGVYLANLAVGPPPRGMPYVTLGPDNYWIPAKP